MMSKPLKRLDKIGRREWIRTTDPHHVKVKPYGAHLTVFPSKSSLFRLGKIRIARTRKIKGLSRGLANSIIGSILAAFWGGSDGHQAKT